MRRLFCACRVGFNDKSLLESPTDFLHLLTIYQTSLKFHHTTDDYPCQCIYILLHITDFTPFDAVTAFTKQVSSLI
jgi:hypothetical protein